MTPTPILHILGGGTVQHVRPHLALSAPAYGGTARFLSRYLRGEIPGPHDKGEFEVRLALTKMADRFSSIETNEDVSQYLDSVLEEPRSRILFLSAALADFQGSVLTPEAEMTASGKDQPRLRSDSSYLLKLLPSEKLLLKVRSREALKPRKDIFLVAFKTTSGASDEEMYSRGLEMMKRGSVNLVLVNDVHRRQNMILTPEQAVYSLGKPREAILKDLADMAVARSRATFVRTRVEEGPLLPWDSNEIPNTFREVVDFAVREGAYVPNSLGVTVGHFAFRKSGVPGRMWSSCRRKNFNRFEDRSLVTVDSVDGKVTARGAYPSAGARSQMILFEKNPEFDCILHFHCPLRKGFDPKLEIRSQRDFECGSNECGLNTAAGIRVLPFRTLDGPKVGAVMLDKHGPNILFRSADPPSLIIEFIRQNFDLRRQTSELGLGAS